MAANIKWIIQIQKSTFNVQHHTGWIKFYINYARGIHFTSLICVKQIKILYDCGYL